MLEIFTDKSLFREEDFVFDNESYFKINKRNEEVTANVIKAIESGEYLDKHRFYDRFGVAIYMSCLSTGSKTLINIASSDKVINIDELGVNAREYMLYKLNGKVYSSCGGLLEINNADLDLNDFRINGVIPKSYIELEDVL